MLNFGLGSLTLIPSGANPTPVQVAILQDISVDFSYQIKKMNGQFQAPIDVARGNLDVTMKAKNANVRGDLLLSALPGATSAAGSVLGVVNEPWAIAASVTVANGATFKDDLGVIDLTSNKSMTRVAAGPTTGQYSVNTATGVYTFAAADVGHNSAISYSYTNATTGKTITLLNQTMGQSTPYMLRCFDTYAGKGIGFSFPAVHVPKLAFALKADAYTEQDLEIIVVQDPASTKICDVYVGE
jgi:hypothetical protein